jgi:hypothetical protein
MAYLNESGLGVHNFYGPRRTRAPKGGISTEGSMNELTVDIWGSSFADNMNEINGIVLPKGALIRDAFAHVSEEFVLGGTTPSIALGTDGSEETNGVVLDEASAEAEGTYELTPIGTWADALTEDTPVSFALGGVTPTITDDGKVRITVRYIHLGIAPDAAAGSKGQGSEE